MDHIYFLTVDKQTSDAHPTKSELIQIVNLLRLRFNLSKIKPFSVDAFEWKENRKYGRRLHYHILLSSKKPYIKYEDARVKGWSIKLVRLKTYYDVARTAGYIQKFKIDAVDITNQPKLSPFKKDDKRNKEIIKTNPMTMYLKVDTSNESE